MKNSNCVSLGLSALLALCSTSAGAGEDSPPLAPLRYLTFEQADVDQNGGLNLFEFAATQEPGMSMVATRRRFLLIKSTSASADGLITKQDLKNYRNLEEKPISKLTGFELADLNGDDKLSPVELSYMFSSRVPFRDVIVRLKRLDLNEDGFVSLREFNK
jgi:hypothetical protein